MKKKVVLVVLCGVLAWAVWGREEAKDPSIVTVKESCVAGAYAWCSSEYPQLSVPHVDEAAAMKALAPHRRCAGDYYRRCAAGRDLEQMVDLDSSLRAIADLQRPWSRTRPNP